MEQTREIYMAIRSDEMPKGVLFSKVLMSAPLFALTGYLCVLAPMAANPAFVDPANFAFLARSALRLLTLNISFMGGIHYGFAAATYETAMNDKEILNIKKQMAYSFIPAVVSVATSGTLLFIQPLQVSHVVVGFTSFH